VISRCADVEPQFVLIVASQSLALHDNCPTNLGGGAIGRAANVGLHFVFRCKQVSGLGVCCEDTVQFDDEAAGLRSQSDFLT
jgi:hypothetical protein